ncbi:MAG: SLC13 family permease [Dehalococcoidales bacterium]|nr:SLC13 family permease [Dehalococcoidales bacterium]
MLSIIILLIVFLLIAVRQVGNIRLQIWQIMLGGAIAVLLSFQISPLDALKSINIDVMLFLFGVFIIGQAMEESGYLSSLSFKLFNRAKNLDNLVLLILFGTGILSAILMNDTLAIIGTGIVLSLAKTSNTKPKILLLALAFAVTIGSVMSPIGNPQNLLIALNGDITNPFVTFLKYLAVPTLINLFMAYLMLKLFYSKHFDGSSFTHTPEPVKDHRLFNIARISLILLVLLILAKIVIVLAGWDVDFKLTYIALIAALPVFCYLPKKPGIIKRIDWTTLVFFASMFVLMQSVWNSEIIQSAIEDAHIDIASTGVIFAGSVLSSQILSNVPLVALYLPMLTHLGVTTHGLMALAAGSTIAGNLTILGAASNVIIIQNAEKKDNISITFWEFIKIGIPLTILNVLVYWIYLELIM